MVIKSHHAALDIPDVDIWTLLFEHKNKIWPDDKGRHFLPNTAVTRTGDCEICAHSTKLSSFPAVPVVPY